MKKIELASTLRVAVAALHKTLRRQSTPSNLYSMTEMETIALLYRTPALLPSELAAQTRITTQSMSQILSKLEEHGLIRRTPSRDDGRKIHISLTAAGRHLVEQSRYERDEWLASAIEKNLSPREQDLLVRALPLFTKLIPTS